MSLREVQSEVTHLSYTLGVFIRLRQLREQPLHLLRRAQVVRVVGHAQPLLVQNVGVGMDTDEKILKRGILLVNIVTVIGQDQRYLQLPAHGDQSRVQGLQLRNALVMLDLQVVITEQLLVPACPLLRFALSPLQNEPRHLTIGTAGEGYQPLVVCLQQFPIDARLVVEPLQVRLGYQLDQVTITGVVPGQEGQVVGALIGRRLGVPALLRYVGLAADDRPDARCLTLGVELDGAVESAMVGDGKTVHTQLPRPLHQRPNSAEAVQKAIFGVNVKMGEHELNRPYCRRPARWVGKRCYKKIF